MEKHLHPIDQLMIDEYISVNKDDMKEELEKAGIDFIIQHVPVFLVAAAEGEYTVAKTVNPKNLLRLASKSSENLVDRYEAEGTPEIIEFTRE